MIQKNLEKLRAELPAGVELVAVSKFRPVEDLLAAYAAGQRVFGESRPQEMASKRPQMPPDVRWHQIGHLQTNKVRLIAPFVELVHSVDSARLALEIDRQAVAAGRVIDALLEIRVAAEETKHGWRFEELVEWLSAREELAGVRFRGVMGMATFTDDEGRVREDFRRLRKHFEELRERFFAGDGAAGGGNFDILSMGMSGDYRIAVEEGATLIRVGSKIFL